VKKVAAEIEAIQGDRQPMIDEKPAPKEPPRNP
jgi:hypothetical protein